MSLIKPGKLSLIILALIGAMAWVACGAAATEPPPAATSVSESTAGSGEHVDEPGDEHDEEADDEHGREVFLAKGCSACHGQDAEGSSIAPALPGHTAEQVTRQLRNPIGTMPKFGPEQVSDEELQELIEYITGLESGGSHGEPVDLASDDVVAMHHWMALLAIKAEAIPEAEHHVKHIIGLVEDAEHRRQMEGVLASLQSGDHHGAEHPIENMLAGTAEPDLSGAELHLQMVLSAIAVQDSGDAQHHMGHYFDEAETSESAQEALEHLEAGELAEAEAIIKGLVEGIPHQHHHH